MSKELTLEDIQKAYERIKPNIKRTLIDYSFNISESLGCNLYLKLEMLQRCKAFKFRGALSKISTLPKGSTIACASAGNHSQGCALASKICGIKCIVYMPETAPQAKVAATKGYGAEVRQYGQTFDEANKKCLEDLEKEKSIIFKRCSNCSCCRWRRWFMCWCSYCYKSPFTKMQNYSSKCRIIP